MILAIDNHLTTQISLNISVFSNVPSHWVEKKTFVVCFPQKSFRDRVLTVGQEIAFNDHQKRIVYVTFNVRTHMQTSSAFSGSIYDFFCHLNSLFFFFFAKPYPVMGVCYLLRGCPITRVSIIEGIMEG